jgi:hypothetical protein
MMPRDVCDEVVDAILNDLTDRKGLRHVWEDIDEDTQNEIKETWAAIIRSRFSFPAPSH